MPLPPHALSNYNGPSMMPTLLPGDGLVIRPYADDRSIQPGDIIAYPNPQQVGDVVHRVIAVIDGRLRTQGDNNRLVDPYLLDPAQVIGQVVSVQRGNQSIPLPGGPAGLRHFRQTRFRRRLREGLGVLFRPLYRALADSGLCRGLIRLETATFVRPEGTEHHLLRNSHSVGRWTSKTEKWEIDFPWRAFMDEGQLPPAGPGYAADPAPSKIPLFEKVAMAFFLFTCFHVIFKIPRASLLPGERTDLLSGALCALAAGAALLARRKDIGNLFGKRELWVVVLLALGGLASGLLAGHQPSSLFRVLVLLASGLGGYVAARTLLDRPLLQRIFRLFCAVMLASLLTAALAGFAWAGYVNYFLESRLMMLPFRVQMLDEFSLSTSLHYWIDLILLLGIVPLGMVLYGRRQAIWGIVLGVVGYAVLILSRVRSAALLPLIGGFGLLLARREVRKYMLVATAVLAAGTLAFAVMFPDRILRLNLSHPSLAYRAEYYPFSWHILKQHPLVGIGLRSPRTGFLCDYQECYPYRDGQWFAYGVQEWVTAENLYLSLLVGMGLPFFLLAIGSVAAGLRKIRRECVDTGRVAASDFHPVAILVVLVLCLGHAMVYDSFLFPQVSWYFCLFLGLGAGPGKFKISDFRQNRMNRIEQGKGM